MMAPSRLVQPGLLLLLAWLLPQALQADGETPGGTHWAFSAFFGSGWYEISNSQSVFIVRAPLQYNWRESSWLEGQRNLGIEYHFPVTLGLHNVDDLGDFTELDNFGSIAFTPGIEVEIPVTEKWYLRPLIHVGWGTETNGGDSAWIYYGGIKSRFTPTVGNLDWSVLNALYYAGYNDDAGGNGSVSMAMAGAEFRHPLSPGFAGRDDLQLNWHLTYSWMFDEAQFSVRSTGLSQSVDDQWELGFALAPRDGQFKVGFLSFAQMGLSFRASSNGDYRAIAINVSSPFY